MQHNLFTLTLIKEKEEKNIIWKFTMNLANCNLENSYRAIQGKMVQIVICMKIKCTNVNRHFDLHRQVYM